MTDTNPRELSVAWSNKADSGGNADSPSRQSFNDFSNRAAVNVSRGDSLAYSEDSTDVRNLLKPSPPVTSVKPCCRNKVHVNDSMTSDDSLQEHSKHACCVLQ